MKPKNTMPIIESFKVKYNCLKCKSLQVVELENAGGCSIYSFKYFERCKYCNYHHKIMIIEDKSDQYNFLTVKISSNDYMPVKNNNLVEM